MPKYTNAEDLMNWLYAQKLLTSLDKGDKAVFDAYTKVQKVLLTSDTVNIVRCEECKNCTKVDDYELWCEGRGYPTQLVSPEGFCDRGKKREKEVKQND